MDLLFATTADVAEPWMPAFARFFPEARQRVWVPGDDAAADFILAWRPSREALASRAGLKAIFNLGAGVDVMLKYEAEAAGTLAPGVPLIKLDDAGMAAQMAEYALYAVLRHFRRFDAYAGAQTRHVWEVLTPYRREDFPVAIMGLGELGAHVAKAVAALGFPVRGWSRSRKTIDGIHCHAGPDEFDSFLAGAQVLISLLPATPHTRGMMNRAVFDKLARGASIVNVARGSQLVDADLLAAIDAGQISMATLDVFHEEPLAADHPFWTAPQVTITPHCAAVTLVDDSVAQIAEKIRAMLAGRPVSGVIDPHRGY